MPTAYQVMRVVHDKDQSGHGESRYEDEVGNGVHPTPHWLIRGRFPVGGPRRREDAVDYANTLQDLANAGSYPFVFTTYEVEEVEVGHLPYPTSDEGEAD